jgi:hypothetical protein
MSLMVVKSLVVAELQVGKQQLEDCKELRIEECYAAGGFVVSGCRVERLIGFDVFVVVDL